MHLLMSRVALGTISSPVLFALTMADYGRILPSIARTYFAMVSAAHNLPTIVT